MNKHILALIISCQMIIGFARIANAQVNANSSLQVAIVHSYASTIAQISIAGKQGHTGVVRIYNAQNLLLKECNIELIPAPYYASIDITNLAKNQVYNIELTTDEGIKNTALLSL